MRRKDFLSESVACKRFFHFVPIVRFMLWSLCCGDICYTNTSKSAHDRADVAVSLVHDHRFFFKGKFGSTSASTDCGRVFSATLILSIY